MDHRFPQGDLVMPSEDATHDVLVDLDAERMSHLLRNARATEARIACFISRIAAMRSFEGPFGPGL